jgi:hypothetical protein
MTCLHFGEGVWKSTLIQNKPVVATPTALELVEDGVVFVEGAQLGAQVVVHVVGLDWPRLHVQVPDLQMGVDWAFWGFEGLTFTVR